LRSIPKVVCERARNQEPRVKIRNDQGEWPAKITLNLFLDFLFLSFLLLDHSLINSEHFIICYRENPVGFITADSYPAGEFTK